MDTRKTLLLFLAGLSLFGLCSACTESQIYECRTTFLLAVNNAGIKPETQLGPVPNIPEDKLVQFCSLQSTFTDCVSSFQSGCTFEQKRTFADTEASAKYICADRPAYIQQISVISNPTTQSAWTTCYAPVMDTVFGMNPSSNDTNTVCPALDTFSTCMITAAKTAGGATTETYIKRLGDKALAIYIKEYKCSFSDQNGTASTVVSQFTVLIIATCSLLWTS